MLGFGLCRAAERRISISGSVRHPLEVTQVMLEKLAAAEVHLNEICTDGEFRGVFKLLGVPLRDLLSLAGIEKKHTEFDSPVDLAVRVTSSSGQSVVLSWGELYYKSTAEVIVATSAHPIFPNKSIDRFKDKDAYHRMMDILEREIRFPKLVVPSDRYADRSIEAITAIEVVDRCSDVGADPSPEPYSPQVTVGGEGRQPVTFEDFSEGEFITATIHVVGDGKGYHGTHAYSGIPLKAVIEQARVKADVNTAFIVSAPDAHRVLVSWGELFLNPHGDRIILARKEDGKPITRNGKFILIPADDLMADRQVKSVKRIEAVSMESGNR
ncbi:hypothetical protein DSCO28_42780 [Desulfosarcina ovata subsp. sediminis]|uniref:Oxidoreductase molybdopterin-binding domain-containing protein n=1 Tax=Desulfosarcina ovata subsp. sediminis TaxID=885957 RepID=A0A5K7ZU26_9BACT|nr:hypothetical protein [Desulfosarcina ovata]BBO83712.1 hypothetical protein DSCO28_42780 [Desulfosarcina ovata subsp. sediminis]